MQDRTRSATGIFARLRAHLRGDRYLSGWAPPAAAAPERPPTPATAPDPPQADAGASPPVPAGPGQARP